MDLSNNPPEDQSNLTDFQKSLRDHMRKFGLPESFAIAVDHPYECRCSVCLDYWKAIGQEPETGKYGPFTEEEINGEQT